LNTANHDRRGFTLIEVLLVILILGMLASVAIVAFRGTREGAKEDTTKLMLDQIETALETFSSHLNRYPTTEEGLKALRTKPQFEDEEEGKKWRGPYLTRDPKDGWNHDVNYELLEAGSTEAGGKPYKLWSNGKDGTSGNEDDIKNYTDEEGTT